MEKINNFLESCVDGVKPFCFFPEYFGSSLKTTEKQVDVKQYMGLWHEIARLPHKYQKECVKSSAEYSWNEENNTVNVLNTCIKANGDKRSIKGFAYATNDNNSKLKVQFFKWISGCYWILDVADDYSWAVVGNPCMDMAWVLGREEEMEKAELQKRLDLLTESGFDISNMVFRGEEEK